MHWFLDPIQKHYADFEGRIGRQEFWMYILWVFGINIVLNLIGINILETIIGLALLVPNIAMSTRRLHDTNRSGWWQLIILIPIIGLIMLIIWLATDTLPVDNSYGKPAVSKDPSSSASTATILDTTVITAPEASTSQSSSDQSPNH